jgi:hypothetical protein
MPQRNPVSGNPNRDRAINPVVDDVHSCSRYPLLLTKIAAVTLADRDDRTAQPRQQAVGKAERGAAVGAARAVYGADLRKLEPGRREAPMPERVAMVENVQDVGIVPGEIAGHRGRFPRPRQCRLP